MAIKSSKKTDDNTKERVISPKESELDTLNEVKLRPKLLVDYIGQDSIKKHLDIAIKSANIRGEPLEHILLYGPPGLGKTTLSLIISNEMGVNLKHTSGPAIEKQADIISILTGISEGDILFIDEIHRLKPQIEEILYGAMEDYTIDIMVGSGTGATSIKMDIPKFTLVGATTKLSSLSSPLRDRFGNIFKLDFYNRDELGKIVRRSLNILGCEIKNNEVGDIVAKKSRGTPRIVNRFVKIVRDYQTVGHDVESISGIEKIFDGLGIDSLGLDYLDRKILETLNSFGLKPIGLNTLSSIVGEEEDTIEDVIEPFLLKIGFIERTGRGRVITDAGKSHIETTVYNFK
ncbi:Holliday junction branch migration DNA helicase RuvB [Candidatus Gracilibacteria bacterium]|nr:Holliday junction branch migration DNA helicase RuvB [Candidatus Gracilibacteria bacterium]